MKKIFATCLYIVFFITILAPVTTSAASNTIRSVDITYDVNALICSPYLTEGALSDRICEQTVLVAASSGAELDELSSVLVYKWAGIYFSVDDSTAQISDERDYYLRFYLTYQDGYSFSYSSLPTVKVNGRTPDAVQWYSLTHRSVCVYVKVDYDAVTPVATSLTLTEHRKMIQRGSSYRFTAVLEGNDEMTWETKYTMDDRTTISQDGLLYVGYDEGGLVVVTVRAKHNPNLFDSVEVYPLNAEPVVSSVTVASDVPTEVERGNSYYLHHVFYGTAEDLVEWTVSGGNGLSYTDGNLLTVDAAETAGTVLTLTVRSTADPTKSDSVAVTVTAAPAVGDISLTYNQDVIWADNGITGKEICALLNENYITLDGQRAYLDSGYSSLVQMDGQNIVRCNRFDTLTVGGEYYLMLNIENEDGYGFDTAALPAVTVNGTPVERVEWYNGAAEDGAIVVFVPFTVHRFGDADADGTIDGSDVAALQSAIEDGKTGNRYDLNRDGTVDEGDLECFSEVLCEMADFSGDGQIDAEDIIVMKGALFSDEADEQFDLTLDGTVDIRDLLAAKKIAAL